MLLVNKFQTLKMVNLSNKFQYRRLKRLKFPCESTTLQKSIFDKKKEAGKSASFR